MGTKTNRPTKREHPRKKANAPSTISKGSNKKTKKLNLPVSMPKAGMIYPFKGAVLKRHRRDNALLVAVRGDTKLFTRQLVDDSFGRMFEVATDILQKQQKRQSPHDLTTITVTDPITFLCQLRLYDSLWSWAQAVDERLFVSLFLVLRSARQNWHNARIPFNIAEHCRLARAIDAFNNVATDLKWNSVDVVAWIRKGGLLFLPTMPDTTTATDEQAKTADDDSDSDDSDTAMPDLDDLPTATAPTPLTKDQEAHRRRFNLTLEQVLESMRLLNIDVDQTALTEAFRRLNIG